MAQNRRQWLAQSGLALAGLGLSGKQSWAREFDNNHDSTYRLPGNIIKLSSNENPHGPSPKARIAMAEAVTLSNRYPWDTTNALREKIATLNQLKKENVLIGAGSSEILGLVAQLAALEKGNAVAADPTFRIWWTAAERNGLEILKVPLNADKKHDLQAMLSRINKQTRLLYLCNPNNPTGTVVYSNLLKSFIEEVGSKCLVLLDEAYIEYCNEPSLCSLVSSNKKLIVAKTFSKIYGMAGARIGYALAHPELIQQLNKLQPWENAGASAVSLAGAIASLDDNDFLMKSKKLNNEAKKFTVAELSKLELPSIPSHTNFLYFSLKNYNGDYLQRMAANNIIAGRLVESVDQWYRITIGTMEEMKHFISAIQ
jgi:histidinol-phosphate aminotransferase